MFQYLHRPPQRDIPSAQQFLCAAANGRSERVENSNQFPAKKQTHITPSEVVICIADFVPGGWSSGRIIFLEKKKKIVQRFLSFKKKERRRVEYPAELVNSWNWYITGETYCPGSEMLEKKQVRTVMVCIEIMRLKWLKRHSGKSKESGQYSNWAATGKDGGCRAATWRNPSEMIELWWLLL